MQSCSICTKEFLSPRIHGIWRQLQKKSKDMFQIQWKWLQACHIYRMLTDQYINIFFTPFWNIQFNIFRTESRLSESTLTPLALFPLRIYKIRLIRWIQLWTSQAWLKTVEASVADPAFPRWEGAPTPKEEAIANYLAKMKTKMTKLELELSVCHWTPTLGSANE